ncbi:D-aminoacyl-tRNA deacylase [uncultured Desulfobacter sp.]|uniref:D-aminoacyl-tRNA deacylase n=1 Tax=uncultured Desulfobacter sp. TaxID=240139 RepID=UPI0029F59D74|nr:D-aminoacyl-tRNA deacylase [uncultured Desulfobacter sp.]
MKAIVQRVNKAHVTVDNTMISSIETGLVVLLGVAHGDTEKDAQYLVDKIINLRIFEDDQEKMNRSLLDVNGELLVVSQFTIMADCRKGRRPSFTDAAPPETACRLYRFFADRATSLGVAVKKGKFQANMDVSLVNQGPVTLILESPKN